MFFICFDDRLNDFNKEILWKFRFVILYTFSVTNPYIFIYIQVTVSDS